MGLRGPIRAGIEVGFLILECYDEVMLIGYDELLIGGSVCF